jgi:hypothetical protein
MRWVDLESGWWTIPATDTKNDESPSTVAELRGVRGTSLSPIHCLGSAASIT